MSLSNRGRTVLAASVVGALALAVAAVLVLTGAFGGDTAEPHVFASVLYDPAEAVPALTLTSHTGEPFSLADVDGEVIVLYFGYTHCPDVCPLTLSNLARAKAALPEDLQDDLLVVMVSVDPARDTAEVLANYVPSFDESFLGLTGSPEEVARVAASWRLFVELGEPDENGNYLVGHPAFTIVLDRAGDRRLKMTHLLTVEQITADLRAVLEET